MQAPLPGAIEPTIADLHAQIEAIRTNPKSQARDEGIYLYTKSARKKMDNLAWEITARIEEMQRAKGDFVAVSGYSGRQSNRR